MVRRSAQQFSNKWTRQISTCLSTNSNLPMGHLTFYMFKARRLELLIGIFLTFWRFSVEYNIIKRKTQICVLIKTFWKKKTLTTSQDLIKISIRYAALLYIHTAVAFSRVFKPVQTRTATNNAVTQIFFGLSVLASTILTWYIWVWPICGCFPFQWNKDTQINFGFRKVTELYSNYNKGRIFLASKQAKSFQIRVYFWTYTILEPEMTAAI